MKQAKSIIPNLLSSIRIVLAPVLFFSIRSADNLTIAVVILLALLTDYTDGYFARRLDSITKAGKILDPLADKLCVAGAALAAVLYRELPIELFLFIAGRDLLILLAGVLIIGKIKTIPVSNLLGKVTVFILSLALVIYVFEIEILYVGAYWLVIIFAAMSLAGYLISAWKLIKCASE